MFRILPILMVALGLFLAVTSFASASTPEMVAAEGMGVCADAVSESAVVAEPQNNAKLVRCWRTVGMGIPVLSCQLEKGVTGTQGNLVPQNHTDWPQAAARVGRGGPPPLADVPPPKA